MSTTTASAPTPSVYPSHSPLGYQPASATSQHDAQATAVAALLAGLGWIAPESQSLGALAAVAVTTLGYFATVWLFVVRAHALTWTAMGWPASWRAGTRTLAADALAGFALIVPTYIVTVLAGGVVAAALGVQLPSALPAPRTVPDAIATVLAAVVIAPVGEEAFFRGFSLSAWRRDLGLRSALLRATLFFAAAHILNATAGSASEWLRIALLQFLVIVPIGYALGWLFARRGIVASIAGHMTFNGMAVLLLHSGATIRLGARRAARESRPVGRSGGPPRPAGHLLGRAHLAPCAQSRVKAAESRR
jgi:membrane protease YdiL (CAAX protease family)